ncbi:hypothetical protein CVS40_9138 [Lucilia cuprina]|nr:hypothetical protein CVS40_9138 [Lucilia cuprina]
MIKLFEEENNLTITVFGLEGYHVLSPFYLTQKGNNIHINLILLEKDERFHYVWIRSKSNLYYIYLQVRKKSSCKM